jgi:hypothetical protein
MAKFETQFRMRCPVCGMVVWQNTLNAYHDFEMLSQQKVARRKWKWIRNLDPRGEAVRLFKMLLAMRLRLIADRLEKEARAAVFSSTSLDRFATETTVSRLPLTMPVERLSSELSLLRVVVSTR